jgi:Mannosyltransferase putative
VPRPCQEDHPLSPEACRVCRWCTDDSEMGAFHRRLWNEPEPINGRAFVYPPSEIVPGLIDPIAAPALIPVPSRWPHDPRVIARHRDALKRLAGADLPNPGRRAGSGLVLVGGGRYWAGNVVAVKMLRDTGSTLPVQIWHRGGEEPIRPADLANLPGVEIRDLTTLAPRPRALGGWESKTVAILASGWERVLFLDSDAYCLRDPAALLDRLSPAEPFLFWEDFPTPNGTVNWSQWGLAEKPYRIRVQGGHLALHVRHFWRELVLAHWLNQHSDFAYTHQYGDQDSWCIALALTGGPHRSLGTARWEEVAFVCDWLDAPFVVHRCQAKMFFPEDARPDDRSSNRRHDHLPAEGQAWRHWQTLLSSRSAVEAFGQVYASGLWDSAECSGAGSSPREARPYLDLVNALIKLSGWRRVVDLGSGDGYIASRLEAPEVVAVECHHPHVQRLRTASPEKQWVHLDLDRDRDQLPSGDVALLKDVLHHWPTRVIRDWLAWAQTCGKWRWLICTQDRHQDADDDDCPLGGHRPLDRAMEPLRSFPFEPVGDYLHKSVLLLPIGGPGA